MDGDRVKTRHGSLYTYLPKGTVMTVAGVVYSGHKIYLKLLSINKVPSTLHPKLNPTRVAVMLGFKFDKSVLQNEEMDKVFRTIEEWVKPFSTYEEALKSSV